MSDLRDIYKRHFNHRIPMVGKFELAKELEEVITDLENRGEHKVLDHLQVALWELLLCQDRSKRLSDAIINRQE